MAEKCPFKRRDQPKVAAATGVRTGGQQETSHKSHQDAREEDSCSEDSGQYSAHVSNLSQAAITALKELALEGAGLLHTEQAADRATYPAIAGPTGRRWQGRQRPDRTVNLLPRQQRPAVAAGYPPGRLLHTPKKQPLPVKDRLPLFPRRQAGSPQAPGPEGNPKRTTHQQQEGRGAPDKAKRPDGNWQGGAAGKGSNQPPPRQTAAEAQPNLQSIIWKEATGITTPDLYKYIPADENRAQLPPNNYNREWATMVAHISKGGKGGRISEAELIKQTVNVRLPNTSPYLRNRLPCCFMPVVQAEIFQPIEKGIILTRASEWRRSYEEAVARQGLRQAVQARMDVTGRWKPTGPSPQDIIQVTVDLINVATKLRLMQLIPNRLTTEFQSGSWSQATREELPCLWRAVQLAVRGAAFEAENYQLAKELARNFEKKEMEFGGMRETGIIPKTAKQWRYHVHTISWEELANLAQKVITWLDRTDLPQRHKADIARLFLPTVEEQQGGYTGACCWGPTRSRALLGVANMLMQALESPGPKAMAGVTNGGEKFHRGVKKGGLGFNQMPRPDAAERYQQQQGRWRKEENNNGRGEEEPPSNQGQPTTRQSRKERGEEKAGKLTLEQLPRPKSFEVETAPEKPAYWSPDAQETGRSTHEVIVAMQAFAGLPETTVEAQETMLCFVQNAATNGTTLRFCEEISLSVNGQAITSKKIMLDDGANVDLMDNAFRLMHGIRMFDFPTRLSTSTNSGAMVQGITEIVGIQYGSGPSAIRSARPFLVAHNMDKFYDVLLGNQDTRAYRSTICSNNNTYTLRRSGQKDLILATISRPT